MVAMRTLLLGGAVGAACGTMQQRALPAGILAEMTKAEGLLKSELKGNPKVLDEEMSLLHGAEHIARKNQDVLKKLPASHASGFLQADMKLGEGASKDASLLKTAKDEVAQLMKGHPAELQREEKALSTAFEAAQHLAHPSLVQREGSSATALAKVESKVAVLEQFRESSMTSALREHRIYAAREGALAKEETQSLAQFANVKDAVAAAFAGKDSKGVKVAMEVGEMLDSARDRQQAVAKVSAGEASRATTEASREAAALAQMSTEGKLAREERTYMSESASLAADDKVVLGKFSGLKGVVAQAFAGRDSQAIEKAMEVGELLDEAKKDQQEVAKRDQQEVSSAAELFKKLQAKPQHASLVQHKEKQQQRTVSASQLAAVAKRLQGRAATRRLVRAAHEHRMVEEEENIEKAVKKSLGADRRAGAAAAEHEVLADLERARRAVERRA